MFYLRTLRMGEENASRKLLIRRIYSMVVSQMENKKKRIQVQDIQDKKGDRFVRYVDEFEYLISSAISLGFITGVEQRAHFFALFTAFPSCFFLPDFTKEPLLRYTIEL